MGRRYGVPVMAQGVVTDAKAPGAQAGWEKMANGLVAALAGSDVVNGLGLLDSHQTLSLEQLVIDDEIFRVIRRIRRGFGAEPERLMLDLIQEVGIGGNFLGKRSTLDLLKAGEHFEPGLGQRGSYDAWLRRGQSELDLARERAERILRVHEPPALPPAVDEALGAILERASGPAARELSHG
jgi:trimethylamine--corrinoid protein Co-methyltransferase